MGRFDKKDDGAFKERLKRKRIIGFRPLATREYTVAWLLQRWSKNGMVNHTPWRAGKINEGQIRKCMVKGTIETQHGHRLKARVFVIISRPIFQDEDNPTAKVERAWCPHENRWGRGTMVCFNCQRNLDYNLRSIDSLYRVELDNSTYQPEPEPAAEVA